MDMMLLKKLLQVSDTAPGKVVFCLSWLVFPLCHLSVSQSLQTSLKCAFCLSGLDSSRIIRIEEIHCHQW